MGLEAMMEVHAARSAPVTLQALKITGGTSRRSFSLVPWMDRPSMTKLMKDIMTALVNGAKVRFSNRTCTTDARSAGDMSGLQRTTLASHLLYDAFGIITAFERFLKKLLPVMIGWA